MIRYIIGNGARLLLGSIRLLTGSIGLFYPQRIQCQMGKKISDPSGEYALRLFGVRTVLIGLDLLHPAGKAHAHAVRIAPFIHASDTIAALLAARSGALPRRAATSLVAISAANTVLSLLMQLSNERDGQTTDHALAKTPLKRASTTARRSGTFQGRIAL